MAKLLETAVLKVVDIRGDTPILKIFRETGEELEVVSKKLFGGVMQYRTSKGVFEGPKLFSGVPDNWKKIVWEIPEKQCRRGIVVERWKVYDVPRSPIDSIWKLARYEA